MTNFNQMLWFLDNLLDFFRGFWALLGRGFYYLIICGIGRIADICQLVFRKFAGISDTGVNVQDGANIINSNQNGGDIALTFISSSIARNLFFALLILAIVILLVTTFVATIKTEFAKDGNNNKRKVIKNAFRGIANFLLVPLICFFALFVGNAVLRALDGATSNGSSVMLTRQIFMSGAYNANRARLSEIDDQGDNVRYKSDSFGERLKTYGNFGIFLDDTGGLNPKRASYKIDTMFSTGYTLYVKQGVITSQEYTKAISSQLRSGQLKQVSDIDIQAISSASANANTLAFNKQTDFWYGGQMLGTCFVGYVDKDGANASKSAGDGMLTFTDGDRIDFSIFNVGLVYYYYDLTLTGFNYIIATIALVFCAYVLLITVLGLIKRIFMIATLFIISAPICAIYPIDDGKALEAWRKEFIKQTLSAYAVIVVMNIFLSLLPLISKVDVFVGGWNGELGFTTPFANYIARILIILAALLFFKDATKTIGALIGAGDAYGDGDGAKKGFVGNIKRTIAGGAMAAGTAKVAGKMTVGALGGAIHSSRNAINRFKDERYKANQLAKEEASDSENGKATASSSTTGGDANAMNSSGSGAGSSGGSGTTGKKLSADPRASRDDFWRYKRMQEEYAPNEKGEYSKKAQKYWNKVESDKKMYNLERDSVLKDLKDSNKFKNASKEDQAKMEAKVNKKYDDKVARADKWSDASLNYKIEKEKKRQEFKDKMKIVKNGIKPISGFVAGTLDSVVGMAEGKLSAKDAWKNQDSTRKSREKAKNDAGKEASKNQAKVAADQLSAIKELSSKMDKQTREYEDLSREMKDMKKDVKDLKPKEKP